MIRSRCAAGTGVLDVALALVAVLAMVMATATVAVTASPTPARPVQVGVEAPWVEPAWAAEMVESWAYVASGLRRPAVAAGASAGSPGPDLDSDPGSGSASARRFRHGGQDDDWASVFDVLDEVYDGLQAKGSDAPAQEHGKRLPDQTAYDLFRRALRAAGASAPQLARWETALAARSTTPRFAARWATLPAPRTPRGCAAWVHLPRSDVDVCHLDELSAALAQEARLPPAPVARMPGLELESGTLLVPSSFAQVPGNTSTDPSNVSAILYADGDTFLTPHALALHHTLHHLAQEGQVEYILRWVAPSAPSGPVTLSAYGASLDLKKVDYLVLDDRAIEDDSAPPRSSPSTASGAEEEDPTQQESAWLRAQFADVAGPSSEANEADAMTPLGHKVSYVVAASSDPIRALRTLVSDLPNHVSWLQSLRLSNGPAQAKYEAFLNEVAHHQTTLLPDGINLFWLNGASVPLTQSDSVGAPPAHQDVQAMLRTLAEEETELKRVSRALNLSPGLSTNESSYKIAARLLNDDRVLRSGSFPLLRLDVSDHRQGEEGALVRVTDTRRHPTPDQEGWDASLHPLLESSLRTSPALVQRNLFEAVWAMDLRSRGNMIFLAEALPYITASVPMTWSVVPTFPVSSAVGLEGGTSSTAAQETYDLARILAYVSRTAGPPGVLGWIQAVAVDVPRGEGKQHLVSVSSARRAAHRVLDPFEGEANVRKTLTALHRATVGEPTDDAPGSQAISAAKSWAKRVGVPPSLAVIPRPPVPNVLWPGMPPPPPPPSGTAFINGVRMPVDERFINRLSMALSRDLDILTGAVAAGEMAPDSVRPDEEDPVEGYFYRLPGTLQVFSSLVKQLLAPSTAAALVDTPTLSVVVSPVQANVSLVLVTDLDSARGQDLAWSALQAAEEKLFELVFVHSPTSDAGDSQNSGEQNVSSALYQVFTSTDCPEDRLASVKDILEHKGAPRPSPGDHTAWWAQLARLVLPNLDLNQGEEALILNGQVVRVPAAEVVNKDDFLAVVKLENAHRAAGLRDAVSSSIKTRGEEPAAVSAGRLARVRVAVSHALRDPFDPTDIVPRVGQALDQLVSRHGSILALGSDSAPLKFTLALDPVSDEAPQWAATLALLSHMNDVQVQLIWNPVPSEQDDVPEEDDMDPRLARLMGKSGKGSSKQKEPPSPPELPLLAKRYTRHIVPEVRFDAQGNRFIPRVIFGVGSVPQEEVLTLALVPPPAWHTMPSKSLYDLDNLRLSAIPAGQEGGVEATYLLTGLLVQGHAMDLSSRSRDPPSGMQLLLQRPRYRSLLSPEGVNRHRKEGQEHKRTEAQEQLESLDTVVMHNLAYFQFRAQPGTWALRLRPGRSSEVYRLVPGQNGREEEYVVPLASLEGITIQPKFIKQPGMEHAELVENPEKPVSPSVTFTPDGRLAVSPPSSLSTGPSVGSLWSSLKSSAGSWLSGRRGGADRHADINIFTIASGHLYERFMSIMILSVLRQTKHSVKFWFVEDFLSPSFKHLLPHLSARYGFAYELISYAWPHWLRAQSEKQRTIWGYKILFLDVLFPLDLDRILFVDADQIVRTDLYELATMDLQGNPYAYPPMGDDSYDMDGFRFWKTGYWKSFLRGKPYHISALYAVDLARFRQLAAGDRLRAHYQALSADKGSLANLDQDLPNSLQFSLPIMTLPKEWLWCETWCSTDWLPQAKTIDLCSNPKTKEPKLDRARRQMPEWSVFDREVAEFMQEIKANRTLPRATEQFAGYKEHHDDL